MRKRIPEIHKSIRDALGYPCEISSTDLLKDWRKKTSIVCKPCWELKYCPYGQFVEQSPILPPLRKDVTEQIDYLRQCLKTGIMGGTRPLDDETRKIYKHISKDAKSNPIYMAQILAGAIRYEKRLQKAYTENEESITAAMYSGSDIVMLSHYFHYRAHADRCHQCRVSNEYKPPFPYSFEGADEEFTMTDELQLAVNNEIEKMQKALKTGVIDKTRLLDDARRSTFEKEISAYNYEDYPIDIPEPISEMNCNVFNHICPVLFISETVAETTDKRRRGRYISFKTKVRVVRRDNYTCQHCGKHLRDDEVEFDHKIPISKGGSSEEHNIRLTCFDCNRDKSDKVEI